MSITGLVRQKHIVQTDKFFKYVCLWLITESVINIDDILINCHYTELIFLL